MLHLLKEFFVDTLFLVGHLLLQLEVDQETGQKHGIPSSQYQRHDEFGHISILRGPSPDPESKPSCRFLPDVICGDYRKIHRSLRYFRPAIRLECDTPILRMPCQPISVILRYPDYSKSEREAFRIGEGGWVEGVLGGVEGVEGELIGERVGGREGRQVRGDGQGEEVGG